MPNLTLSVLGELQVLIDNAPISSIESDKVRALLAYLAVEASRSHRRETLSGLLWPDCSEESARHNLRQALFNLRLALGDHTATPPFLLITHDTIQFNQESSYSLDLAQFNAYFEDWEKSRRQEEGVSTVPVSYLEAMVQLYRGEFLQHFFLSDSAEFEEWKLVQRETLHQHAMDALDFLTDHYDQQGDYQNARRFAKQQLELDPWREEAHCQLMRILALEGQRSAALAQYETCRRVLSEELGVEPSQKTRDLYDQIRSGILISKAESPTQVHITPLHNLPVSLTPFIGREPELTDLGRLIANPECRCITLVGPGGIGKTRLALQITEQHKNDFAQGSAFIPLAAVENAEAIIPAIASAIQFSFSGPGNPKVQLLNYLRGKHLLLVVDNIEHLLREAPGQAASTELLMDILQHAPGVKLLVTSREALNLQEEWLFEVQGLNFPKAEQIDCFEAYDATALFVQRAQRTRPGMELESEDQQAIARLCRLVEGMPLAIELAATWVRVLSPSEIAAEIEHNLEFLEAPRRDLPERHRSMRAVFDHSWQALSIEERQALGKLSVFRGGFSRAAAGQVTGATLSVLASLVTRSLLRRTTTGRYDLHELVRQFAALKLAEDPAELYAVQERHSQYYLGWLGEKDGELRSQRQKSTLAELTLEMDNFRAAWDWCITHQVFLPLYRVSIAAWYLHELPNWFQEGEARFWKTAEALRVYLNDTGSADNLCQTIRYAMLAHCGSFIFRQGRSEEAYAMLAPSADFLRKSDDPKSLTSCLISLGITCWELGRFSEARETLLECLDLSRTHKTRWIEALANEFLGVLSHDQGDYAHARDYLSEALRIMRRIGDPSMTAHELSYLGRTMQAIGQYPEAEKILRESLALAQEMDYRFGAGLTLDALGQAVQAQARLEEAGTLFSKSADLFREMSDTHRLARTLNHRGLNSLSRKDLAAAEMDFREALKLAHEGGLIPTSLYALTGLAVATNRERASLEDLGMVIFILRHPACNEETKTFAEQLREKLETQLSPNEVEVAEIRSLSLILDELISRALGST